jgi:DNA helicase-2/ATP-dependent DNA helicase PcrA
MNQTLEKQEDLSLYDQIRRILNKKKSSLITINKSFRCTNEILKFSSRYCPNVEIKSFNRSGSEPQVYVADDRAALHDMILSEIAYCLKEGYESIALICKSQKNAVSLHRNLKERANIQLIKNQSSEDLQGVSIMPVYMSKGLEFDAVLVCDAGHEHYRQEEDKKLLYIACSRALHRLNLFCMGKACTL